MPKKIQSITFSLFLILSILTTITSCNSLPSVRNSSHSLMVVVIETNIPRGLHSGIATYFELKVPGSNEVMYIKQNNPFVVGKNLSAGTYNNVSLVQRVEETQGGGWVSGAQDNAPINVKVDFSLKGGHLNFFPVKFVYTVTKWGGGTSSGWNMVPLTNNDIQRTLIKLKSNSNFKQWKSEY